MYSKTLLIIFASVVPALATLDCGGGRAAPKTDVPGCPGYTGSPMTDSPSGLVPTVVGTGAVPTAPSSHVKPTGTGSFVTSVTPTMISPGHTGAKNATATAIHGGSVGNGTVIVPTGTGNGTIGGDGGSGGSGSGNGTTGGSGNGSGNGSGSGSSGTGSGSGTETGSGSGGEGQSSASSLPNSGAGRVVGGVSAVMGIVGVVAFGML